MALTFRQVNNAVGTPGTFRETVYDVTLDNSYPTGGEAISAKDVGLSSIYGMEVIGVSTVAGTAPTTGYTFQWDFKNGKLQAFTAGGAVGAHSHSLLLKDAAVADGATTRVNAGTNLLGANTGSDITVAGGGANGGVQAATPTFTAAANAEVANATNLSTVVVRVRVAGI